MLKIELEQSSVVLGNTLAVFISHPQALSYRQVQIEVFDTAVLNPSPKLGFSTAPILKSNNVLEIKIDTNHLVNGLFEIRLVRLHDPITPEDIDLQLDFLSRRDFERKVFKVIDSIEHHSTLPEIILDIEQREKAFEDSFMSPIDIRPAPDGSSFIYSTFVFIKDVLIGTRIRFEHFELVPTHRGLDSKDYLDFVNNFLQTQTSSGVIFHYDDTLRTRSHQLNPVCIVHFRSILALSFEDARDYCVEQTNLLLLSLSLSRDAGGEIFDIVLFNHMSGECKKFLITLPYVGNLLTGHISGENPDTLEAYLSGLKNDPMNYFLISLFKEAKREKNPDFQYVRYWQILEIMADSCNYDQNATLYDYDGNIKMDGNSPLKINSSTNKVFNLFRENGIGNTQVIWKNVNIWFAFRSAVAHHGAITQFNQLSRPSVRKWAQLGLDEIQATAGHDSFLWNLKEDTKLLLMRHLTQNAGQLPT